MAISRGAGTEIIRTACFEGVNTTTQDLIVGVQHHIYSVLSVIVFPTGAAAGSKLFCQVLGYDSKGGTTAQQNYIFVAPLTEQEVFVWNDKFSFNGYEPTDFSGPMDDATKQDAIADQGSSVAQKLQCYTLLGGDDDIDVTVTYIDQNNA